MYKYTFDYIKAKKEKLCRPRTPHKQSQNTNDKSGNNNVYKAYHRKGLISQTYKIDKEKSRPIEKWAKDKDTLYTKKYKRLSNAFKKCPTLFRIREMQIKTMLRYQFSPIGLAKLKRAR